MKFRISHVLAAAAAIFATQSAMAVITGSKHDFSASGWTTEICLPCHAPHNNKNAAGSVLWNHANSTATYTLYSSPTMNALQPTTLLEYNGTTTVAVSKLCLSCHDGTVALDKFGTRAGATFMGAISANLGTDLSNDHPIAITYDATLVTADNGGLKAPGTLPAGMLYGTSSTVECTSCHDVHNKFAPLPSMLRVTNAASALCLTCHIK